MERVRTNTAHVARGPPANDALIVNVRGKDWPRGNWPLNFLSKIFPRHRRQREKNLPFQGAFRLSRNAYRVTIRNFTKQLRRRGRGERESCPRARTEKRVENDDNVKINAWERCSGTRDVTDFPASRNYREERSFSVPRLDKLFGGKKKKEKQNQALGGELCKSCTVGY